MIKTFSHKGMEDFFYDGIKKGIQAIHAQKLADILDRLDAAENIKDMKFPGSDLHQLKGKMKGRWAVKVSGNWLLSLNLKKATHMTSITSIIIKEVKT